MPSEPLDPVRLGRTLAILGSPVRLRLLLALQRPRTLADLRIPPERNDRGRRSDRPVSRQTLQRHLDQLESLGLVTARPTQRAGRPVHEYVANKPHLFLVTEQLRALARLESQDALEGTLPASAERPADLPEGGHLLLLRGVDEGRAFPLDGPGPWRIGRAASCEVRLDYDPYVSSVHAMLEADAGRLVVRPHAQARNPVAVTLRPLRPGVPAPVAHGDTLHVGRSLLLLRLP